MNEFRRKRARIKLFQSRNRGSFDFKYMMKKTLSLKLLRMFQSRNRGSFDFKLMPMSSMMTGTVMFQSRNRGSFDFKAGAYEVVIHKLSRFNLVIEVLLISSQHQKRLSVLLS